MRIRYDQQLITSMSLFAKITGVQARDCFPAEGSLYFVVNPGEAGRAIGKGGMNIKKLHEKLGQRIRIVEYSHLIDRFIKNMLHPLKVEITVDDHTVNIQAAESKARGIIIGRNAKNLNMLKNVVQRYFSGYTIQVA